MYSVNPCVLVLQYDIRSVTHQSAGGSIEGPLVVCCVNIPFVKSLDISVTVWVADYRGDINMTSLVVIGSQTFVLFKM